MDVNEVMAYDDVSEVNNEVVVHDNGVVDLL